MSSQCIEDKQWTSTGVQANDENTEIRFVDVDLLEVRKDFLQIEIFELVKQEIEAVFVQLWACPLHLVYLSIDTGMVQINIQVWYRFHGGGSVI